MLARVKPKLAAVPLAVLLCLVLAAPAAAAFDWRTSVVDFEFQPAERKISVGDTVTWDFTVGGHTTASRSGQPDSWKSIATGANAAGTSFTHQFNTPGKYQYVCLQHRDFMKGTVEVGTDAVIDTLDNFKTKRIGRRAKLSFRLNEAATVTYKLKGPSPKTVKKGRLAAGRHSFTVKRLKRGTYRGVLTVVDDFDKKITPRNFFVIR
jgi:plastocyanin